MAAWKKLFESSTQKTRRPVQDPEHFSQLQAEFMRHYGKLVQRAIGVTSFAADEEDALVENALRAADEMIALEPQRAVPWTYRCLALGAALRFSEALEANKHAIEIDPSDPDKWDLQANVLRSLGKADEAKEAADMARDLRERTHHSR